MLYPVYSVIFKEYIGFGMLLIGIVEEVAEAIAGYRKGYFGALFRPNRPTHNFSKLAMFFRLLADQFIGLAPIVPVVF